MNTKEVQDKVMSLKAIDTASYKTGVKSAHVLNFVRDEFIKRAFDEDKTMGKITAVNMNMTVASYLIPSITLLTKDGQYPALLTSAVFVAKDGELEVKYSINKKALSAEYVEKLNDKLQIAIEA